MKKYLLLLVFFIVGIGIGYTIQPTPTEETKVTDRSEEVITRVIVRTSQPDGSKTETIKETEKRKVDVKISHTKTDAPKRFVAIAASPQGKDLYQIDLGYRILPQIAVKAGVIRHDRDYLMMVGLQLDF